MRVPQVHIPHVAKAVLEGIGRAAASNPESTVIKPAAVQIFPARECGYCHGKPHAGPCRDEAVGS